MLCMISGEEVRAGKTTVAVWIRGVWLGGSERGEGRIATGLLRCS